MESADVLQTQRILQDGKKSDLAVEASRSSPNGILAPQRNNADFWIYTFFVQSKQD